MKITQISWDSSAGWKHIYGDTTITPQLILCFGSRSVLTDESHYYYLHKNYPNCTIVCSSSGGEILNDEVHDNTIIATLIEFEKTTIKAMVLDIISTEMSFDIGQKIAQELNKPDLAGIFLITDGLSVNGSRIVSGLSSLLHNKIPVTGGMASDGENFEKTLVGLNAPASSNKVVAIGFYGKNVKIGHGSMGGWVPFGPEREITKSKGNILYELSGRPALTLYKKYLGDSADKLPSEALLYPLSIKSTIDSNDETVRTVLAVDEEAQSLTFAGDIPEGSVAQLMYGNFDNLIEGAENAAEQATINTGSTEQLAILISCIGRRMLMGQNINDELEAIYSYWNKKIPLTGFYSYGEISPHQKTGECSLHNQTMTITTIGES
jgi:hypothetical protein